MLSADRSFRGSRSDIAKKRIFLMAPIHHHFEKRGWAEPQIVIRFWIISLILAMLGLATLKVR